MSKKLTTLQTAPSSLTARIHAAITAALPGAEVEVSAARPGHFALVVVSELFRDKPRVARQRLVYQAIASLMQGDAAPVHAIDQLKTLAPGE